MNSTFLGLLTSIVAGSTPLEPGDSIREMLLPSDLVVEIVAAEPLVVDPVAIAFDEHGDLFVAEYRDYPLGPPGKADPSLSRVKKLRDVDGDGRMDTATLFADNLPWCQGVLPWREGVLVTVAEKLLYLVDEDGDGVSDRRTTILEGLGRANPQLQPAFPTLGPDGCIYLTNGLSGGDVHTPDRPSDVVHLGNSDLRWNPDSGRIDTVNGQGQFGQTFDDWGNRFTCSNRNPIIHDVVPASILARNRYAHPSAGSHDVAPSGALSRVYPAIETTTTAYSHTGTHTAACGVLLFRGIGLGPEFDGCAFVCDPTGHLVTANRLRAKGVTFESERILQETGMKVDWLASKDRWFRPVSLANGPDGCLYVVDMYREIIEHPQYMPSGPPPGKNLRAGEDRGRVYRIRRRDGARTHYQQPETERGWSSLLGSEQGWRRDTAFRKLLDAHEPGIGNDLRKIFQESSSPASQVAALRLLHLRGEANDADLESALDKPDPRVISTALQIMRKGESTAGSRWARVFLEYARHDDARIRFEALAGLGLVDGDEALPSLLDALRASDPFLWASTKSVLEGHSGDLLALASKDIHSLNNASMVERLGELAFMVGARRDESESASVLETLLQGEHDAWDLTILRGLAEGLARHQGEQRSLESLLASPSETLREGAGRAREVLDRVMARKMYASPDATIRKSAIKALALVPEGKGVEPLLALIRSSTPTEDSFTALGVLRSLGKEALLSQLLDHWNEMQPAVQSAAIPLLLERLATTKRVLEKMAEGSVLPALVGIDRREILLAHRDPQVRELAAQLFGATNPDRAAVVATYAARADKGGDVHRGEEIFKQICASCHRFGTLGKSIGPDITDVRQKTPEQLVGDILDPNRIVEPRYASTAVLLQDGRTVTGLLTRETRDAITLSQANLGETDIPRDSIDQLQTSTRSLMPEGLERDISPEDMASLIQFLKTGR